MTTKLFRLSAILSTVLLVIVVAVYVPAGKTEAQPLPTQLSVFRFNYAYAGEGQLVLGYLDTNNDIFYQYHGIVQSIQDVPEVNRENARIAPIRLAGSDITVTECEAPIVLLSRADNKYDVGYFIVSRGAVFRWKGLSLDQEAAKKALPVAFKNVMDAKKLKLIINEIAVPEDVKAQFAGNIMADKEVSTKSAKSADPTRSVRASDLSFWYTDIGKGQLAPGYLDTENKVFYQYDGIVLSEQDVPEVSRENARSAPLNPAEANLTVVECEAPIVLLTREDKKYDVGYFVVSRGTVYRWKELSLDQETAKKALPFAFKNAMDAKKLKLKVTDITVPDNVKARFSADKETSTKPTKGA